MFCPNINTELYKTLDAKYGKDVAYGVFYQMELPKFSNWYNGALDSQKLPALVDGNFVNQNGEKWSLDEYAKSFDKRDAAVQTILKRQEGLTKDDKGYLFKLRRVANRVSEKAKAAGRARNKEVTPEQEADFALDAEHGNLVHSFVENISDRINKNAKPPVFADANEQKVYKELEAYFIPFFTRLKEEGAIVMNEVMIYDKATDTAGTVDILAVGRNGKISIYDIKTVALKYKTVEGKKEYSTVHTLKRNEYDMQVSLYKDIVQGYGFAKEDFDKLRIIPVNRLTQSSIKNSAKQLVGIEVGSKAVVVEEGVSKTIERDHLEMMVVANEVDKDAQIAKLVLQYKERIKDIAKRSVNAKNKEQRALLYEQQADYSKLIDELMINRDYVAVLETARNDFKILKQNLDTLSVEDINVWMGELELYKNIEQYIPYDTEDKDLRTQIAVVKLNASELYNILKEKSDARIRELAQGGGVEHLLDKTDRELGMWQRWFRGISQINNSMIAIFNKLIVDAKNRADTDAEALAQIINVAAKGVGDWASARGIASLASYDNLINQYTDENGKKRMRLVDRFSDRFYADKKEGKLSGVGIDKAKYAEGLAKYQATIASQTFNKYNAKNDAAKKKEYIDQWIDKNSNVNTAQKSMLVVSNEQYFSDKWVFINRPENKPLLDFFDVYTKTMGELSKELPYNTIRGGFIPNVRKTLVEQVMRTPGSYFGGLHRNLKETLKIKDNEGNNIESKDKDYDVRIPILYLNQNDTDNQSTNLGVSLMLFAQSALNYKYMSELEDDARLLANEVAVRPQILTDDRGRVKRDAYGNPEIGQGNTQAKELLETAIKYNVYGIKDQSKDTQVLGVSVNKSIKTVLRFFSTKTLAFNTLSGFVGTLGGLSNSYMQGAKGRFYDNTQMSRSLWMLASNNRDAYEAVKYFDFKMDKNRFGRARALSVSTLDKHLTADKFFFLQQFGDTLTQNGIVLSIMQNHTYKNGAIAKIGEGEKNLIEQIKEGLVMDRETKLAFEKRVEGISKSILGNMGTEDRSAIRTTVMGQALMMFRNWIPRTIDERFGELRENQEIGGYEVGRYRYFFNGMVKKGVLPAISELTQRLLLFRNPKATQENLKLEYELVRAQRLADGDTLNMTEEEYVEMQMGNIRATIMELRMIMSVLALFFAMGGNDDDDDDRNGFEKYAIKSLDRLHTELAFYVNPLEAMQILKSPVAGTGALTDIVSFFKYGIMAPFDEKSQDKFLDSGMKMIPVVNGATKMYEIVKDSNEGLE